MKKILVVTEASFLKTGYSTYSYEVCKRLHATKKFEIAELGCFATPNDPQQYSLPWKFYGNLPNPNSKEENLLYKADQLTHPFGAWKFEQVLLDFQPDIVFSFRDWWNDEFIERSPFRPYYHWVYMPTVDAEPQNPQWISTFMNADSIFSYSDWGANLLRKNQLINVIGSAPPGADLDSFYPVQNKQAHRQKLNLPTPPNSFIVGTVMRSQRRKLFPDLIESFRIFLDRAPREIADKSYLYMHTSHPDWWDIPGLIIQYGVSHRALFTYKCSSCLYLFINHYNDARMTCPQCKKMSAFLPNTHVGVERSELADVINCFDVYAQYANSEGFGMGQVEAASCGVPVFSVDYSAMSDIVRKLRGYTINYLRLVPEGETGCLRAVPDNEDFVNKLIKYAELPESWKNKKRNDTRKAVEQYYDWDKTAKIWEEHFDHIEPKDPKSTWKSPPKQHSPNMNIPYTLPAEQFVRWIILHVAGRPDLLTHYIAMKLIRDIQWGMTVKQIGTIHFNDESAIGVQPERKHFTKQDAVKEMIKMCEHKNFWESKRGLLV